MHLCLENVILNLFFTPTSEGFLLLNMVFLRSIRVLCWYPG